MEVKLDKRYTLETGVEQAWAVLSDIRAVAACMPGAAITGQVDDSHYKGTVRTKVGPAQMQFGGDIELQALDAATHTLQMLGKGADKAGSSATMKLLARLEPGATPGQAVLAGQATVTVTGKLAQFGSRLLVPVSDAMLAQFADNFRAAAAALPTQTAAAATQAPPEATPAATATPASAPSPAAPSASELNALALMWTVFKSWLAGLFGRRA